MQARDLVLVLLVSVGCQPVGSDLAAEDDLFARGKADSASDTLAEGELLVPEGSPEAVGVLRLLGSGSVTFEMLDDEVGLDRRAAQAIVDHLTAGGALATVGPSGRMRSPNGLFDLGYVKNRALGKLVAYASRNGLVPTGDELLGEWDDVSFTVAEARSTLRLANEESFGILDREVGLQRDTALNIVNARPLRTIWELAHVREVGRASLAQLRDHVRAVEAGRRCRQTLDCPSGQRCLGIPYDGSGIYGKCRDLHGVPGAGTSCDDDSDCPSAELRCLGRSLPWDFGMCMENWMYDTFTTTEPVVVEAGGTADSPVVVHGQATVPLDLVVALDIDLGGVDPSDLTIQLLSPDWSGEGTGEPTYAGTVWYGPLETRDFTPDYLPEPGAHRVPGTEGIARDHGMNGRYTLRIDNAGAGTVTLNGWTLDASSNWD